MREKPIIGITMGDPSGIGPEIAAKTFADSSAIDGCSPLLIGDAAVMKQTLQDLQLNLNVHSIQDVEEALFQPGTINIYDLKRPYEFQLGEVSAASGELAFQAVKTVIELALAGKIDATVTGPIHKEAINLAGHRYAGHTEIYADLTNSKEVGMLLVEGNFRVIHVSTHVSLRQACDLVKKERICEVTHLLHEACLNFGVSTPRIAVAGLNPHASDGGLFGNEEQNEIIPAIDHLTEEGLTVEGPFPPDTLFTKVDVGSYDGFVAMYHDQGHIPFKMRGFNWNPATGQMEGVQGVNITLGLPIVRVSVDHGTAFEIAGKGVACPDALMLAVDYAKKMTLEGCKA